MHHLGIMLAVLLPCLLGAWANDRYTDGGKLAGAAIGLFAALGIIVISSFVATAKKHGGF